MNNKYQIKVYNKDGTFKKNINQKSVIYDVNFSSNINAGQGEFNLLLNYAYTDSTISLGDFVKVFIFNNSFKNGKIIYTGIVEEINRNYKQSQNNVELVCRGLGSLLSKIMFYSGSYSFSKNDTASNIINEVIAYFNTKFSGNWINSSKVSDSTGNINIDFSYNTCLEAITKVTELTNFYFFIDCDGSFIFKEKNDLNISHKFTAKKDLQNIEINEDTSGIINKAIVSYATGDKIVEDVNSIALYGLKEGHFSESDINDEASAEKYGLEVLNNNKNPKYKIEIEINKSYKFYSNKNLVTFTDSLSSYTDDLDSYFINRNIETIKPGEYIKVRNMEYSINGLQIVKVDYRGDSCMIYLDEINSIGKILKNRQ